MYVRDRQLGDVKSFLKKTQKLLHDISPRELSLVRMANKYGSDAKKKASARLQTVATLSAQHAATQDAVLKSQIAQLDAALPDEIKADFPAPVVVRKPAMPAWAPYAFLGGLGVLGAMLYRRRR